jgi:8-oxo-dGTP pyrophosphatase MutT (NUDIX family)
MMVEQYRPIFYGRFIECPDGQVRKREANIEAADWELHEETGFSISNAEIKTTYAPVAVMRYERTIVLARDQDYHLPDQDDPEFIQTRLVSFVRELLDARNSPSTG